MSFLRDDLRRRRFVSCREAMDAPDRRWVEVVHLVSHRIADLSRELASVGSRGEAFPLPHGRGDEFHHGSPGRDARDPPLAPKSRDIVDPTLRLDGIQVKGRNFR